MLLPNPLQRLSWTQRLSRAAIVIVLIALGVGVRPGYRWVKHWRAENMAETAERLLAQQPQAAFEKAQASLLLAPEDKRSLHAVARAATRLEREDAFNYWHRFLGEKPPTGSDRQEIIDLALKFRRVDLAAVLLNNALKETPEAAATLRAAALCSELKNDHSSAIHFASNWLRVDPTNAQAQLFLARHLIVLHDPDQTRRASQLLWAVVRAKIAESAPALDLLVTLPTLSKAETEEALQRLIERPGNDPRREFVIVDLRLRLDPGERTNLVAATTQRFQGADQPVLILLARWLSQKGEYTRVLNLISSTQANTNHELFLLQADALAGLSKWTDLETVLNQNALPLEPILAELYRARVAGELKKDRQKSSHWAQVHRLGAKNPGQLAYVAQYAERIGEWDQAEQAFRRLTEEPSRAREAWLGLIRLAAAKPDTGPLRKLMAELTRAFPEDPAPQNDLAYLELLVGENAAGAGAVARRLVQQHPTFLAYRTTLALAHLRTQNLPAAKAAYENLSVSWATTSPNMRAVYAAVLGANGEVADARKVAASIPTQQLRAEEQALVKPWL